MKCNNVKSLVDNTLKKEINFLVLDVDSFTCYLADLYRTVNHAKDNNQIMFYERVCKV